MGRAHFNITSVILMSIHKAPSIVEMWTKGIILNNKPYTRMASEKLKLKSLKKKKKKFYNPILYRKLGKI